MPGIIQTAAFVLNDEAFRCGSAFSVLALPGFLLATGIAFTLSLAALVYLPGRLPDLAPPVNPSTAGAPHSPPTIPALQQSGTASQTPGSILVSGDDNSPPPPALPRVLSALSGGQPQSVTAT